MYDSLRRPAWPAPVLLRALSVACALAFLMMLVSPGSVQARRARNGHSSRSTHKVIVHRRCSLKERKRAPKKRRCRKTDVGATRVARHAGKDHKSSRASSGSGTQGDSSESPAAPSATSNPFSPILPIAPFEAAQPPAEPEVGDVPEAEKSASEAEGTHDGTGEGGEVTEGTGEAPEGKPVGERGESPQEPGESPQEPGESPQEEAGGGPPSGGEEAASGGGEEPGAGYEEEPGAGYEEEAAEGKEEERVEGANGGEQSRKEAETTEAMATPLSATGEDFASAPSDVLLTYSQPVTPSVASECVAVDSEGEVEEFGGAAQGPSSESVRLYLAPEAAMPAKVRCPAETQVTHADAMTQGSEPNALPVSRPAPTSGGVVDDPIDPKYLTEAASGARSDYIQPWRAYMETLPASQLIDSLGINFNVEAKEADDTAQLLQEGGFKLARIEIGWNSLSYEDPSKFSNEAGVDERLEALHKHGLRPLILLNSNSGQPTPAKTFDLELTAAAPADATSVKLTKASAEKVVLGKTGFNNLGGGYAAPNVLITAVNAEDVATLSKPLPAALTAGSHGATTVLYAPFGPPELADGERNPVFQETLDGWLSYVATICKKAASIFGPEGYDLEVWNELTFGSQFLHGAELYYSPARETGKGSVEETLLDETVGYVRAPANGIPDGVGIGDGFTNTTIPSTGEGKPKGLTALDKHPYESDSYFPATEDEYDKYKPLNALGEAEYTNTGTSSDPIYTPPFKPAFKSELPEYYLTDTQPQTLTREIAPITTTSGHTSYGRSTGPEGGPPLQTWITEYNLQHTGMIGEREGHSDEFASEVSPAQGEHLQAEIALRSLTSLVSKGMSREYFYAAVGEGWNLVSEAFTKAVKAHPSSYPGFAEGGETIASFKRMMEDLQGPGPAGEARQLSLLSIAQEGNDYQFKGNGTAEYPDLYNREMLAVLPFQSSPSRFVIPVYVISENLTTIEKPSEPEESIYRYDLPPENYRITLGGLPESWMPPTVSAYDPITGEQTPAKLISRKGNEAVIEIAATDYPRLLSIEYPTQ
jgi:hypothetical protein